MINVEAANRAAAARLDARKSARDENVQQLKSLAEREDFDWRKVEAPTRLAVRARRLGLSDVAEELLRDPTDLELGRRVFERIIGANNLLDVMFLSEGARMSRAVARVTLPVAGGTRLGTAFMVSSRVAMTNNHVLGSASEAANATLEFDFFTREDGTTGPVVRFRLDPAAFFLTDERLDFTVVAVEAINASGARIHERGWFPLIGPSGKAIVGERVSIIQHPNGDPQKVTVHDNTVVDVDVSSDFLHYETDTMGGSSGSPVLNVQWDLAALHHAAVGDTNEGVRISSIVTRLRQMLGSEAAGRLSASGRELATELLSGQASPPSNGDGGRAYPASGAADRPAINPDGSVSWTLPLRLTIGVGEARAPGATPAVVRAGVTAPIAGPPAEDPKLTAALRAIEEADARVYYSEANDKKACVDYYPDLDGLGPDELYDALSQLMSDTHHTSVSYRTARLNHLYPWIDRREGSGRPLKGIYSNKTFDALEVIRDEVAMELRREQAIRERMLLESLDAVDDAFLETLEAAHPFNCEHVVPQSWFGKRKVPQSDLHHLFTCEWGCNSFRGNRAYFDFQAEALREGCGESAESKFEPKGGKGAVARATLYFLLRYPGDVADSAKEMPRERLATVIRWAKSDKVDRWERHRNAEIQKVQGNRNPLIDFPELVDRIDFGKGWA